MSPAPYSLGRSPPCVQTHDWWTSSAEAVIVPPAPRASRSFVLAAARLRALHLDPLRTPPAPSQLPRGPKKPCRHRPPSS